MKRWFLLLTIATFILPLFTFLNGCGDLETTTNVVSESVATESVSEETSSVQSIASSMASWINSGSVESFNLDGSVYNAVVVTDLGGGSYHITLSTTEGLSTYSADIYATVEVSLLHQIGTVEMSGSFTSARSYAGYTILCTQEYGTSGTPIKGTATLSSGVVSSITISGGISSTLQGRLRNIMMTLSTSTFTLPVTTGTDYPTGSITIATTYNGMAQDSIIVTFNGTSTGSITYGTKSGTFPIKGY